MAKGKIYGYAVADIRKVVFESCVPSHLIIDLPSKIGCGCIGMLPVFRTKKAAYSALGKDIELLTIYCYTD